MKAGVPRLGVFASSFNPVTCAHLELMRRAAEQYSLDEVIALAGILNADKTSYDCPLSDRLKMLLLAIPDDAPLSVGISSWASIRLSESSIPRISMSIGITVNLPIEVEP